MPRPKKQKDSPEINKESELYKILIGLNKDKNMARKLVSELEKIPRESKPLDFCQAYTILLFQRYIEDKNDREMMLAMCGLLEGFEFQPQKFASRMWEYQKCAKYYNDFFKGKISFTSIGGMCRKELLRISRELEEKLIVKLAEKGGRLSLIDDVPKELKLPAPRKPPARESTEEHITSEIIIDTLDKSKIVITRISGKMKKVITISCDNIDKITIIGVLALVLSGFLVWSQRPTYRVHIDDNGEYVMEKELQKNISKDSCELHPDPTPQFENDNNQELVDIGTVDEAIESNYYSLGNINLYVEDASKKRKFNIVNLGESNGSK